MTRSATIVWLVLTAVPGTGTALLQAQVRSLDEAERIIDALRSERKALQSTQDEAGRSVTELDRKHTEEIARLRAEVQALLKRLVTEGLKPPQPRPAEPSAVAPSGLLTPTVTATARPIDELAWGRALFQMGDYAGAIEAFRSVERGLATARTHLMLDYLIATCYRKLARQAKAVDQRNKFLREAETLYARVGKSKDDLRLAEYARWQVQAIHWQLTTEKDVADLKLSFQRLFPEAAASGAEP